MDEVDDDDDNDINDETKEHEILELQKRIEELECRLKDANKARLGERRARARAEQALRELYVLTCM